MVAGPARSTATSRELHGRVAGRADAVVRSGSVCAGTTSACNAATGACVAPAVAVTAPADGAYVPSGTPSFSGTATPGQTVTVTIDSTVVGTAARRPKPGDDTRLQPHVERLNSSRSERCVPE
jgi:hypothetical protein